MNLFKLFLIVFCILLFSPSAKLQSATTINDYNSSITLANGTNVSTFMTTVTATNNNNSTNISTKGTNASSYITTVTATNNSNSTNISTSGPSVSTYVTTVAATNNNNLTNISTSGPSVSTYITTAAFALTNSPTINGQFKSRIKILCSFNDTFIQEYHDLKSQILYGYLVNIFSKLSTALPKDIIQLKRLVVYSVYPGSVVVNMRADFRSVTALDDSMLINIVRKAILTAFSSNANILQISVVLSSTQVKKDSSWIAGLVVLIVLAIIFIVIAILLFKRYFPGKCSKLLKKTNASTTNETNFELEYDNRYHDKYPIVD